MGNAVANMEEAMQLISIFTKIKLLFLSVIIPEQYITILLYCFTFMSVGNYSKVPSYLSSFLCALSSPLRTRRIPNANASIS